VANGPVQNGELAVSLSSINNLINLDMILKAYETESLAQLIAEPRIVVQDQESATLNESQSSSRFTFVNGAGGSASISSSLSLNVKPQLAGENVVQLEIQVSRTSPTSPNSSSASGTVSRSANTKVFLKNGETTVISGLYQTSRLKSKGQIPILGSLPLIGWMFRLNDELTKKTELLIMVTPRILNDDSPQVNQANGDIMAEASESPVSLNTATSSGLNSTVEADPAAANAAASEEVPAINSPASSENSSANGTK
jgi:type IV pilus assembly protein PilQ